MSKIEQLKAKLDKAEILEIQIKNDNDLIKRIIKVSTPQNLNTYYLIQPSAFPLEFHLSLAELRDIVERRKARLEEELRSL